jgi:hypothetical protein
MIFINHFKVSSYFDESFCSIEAIRFDSLDEWSVSVDILSFKILYTGSKQ